LKKSIDNKKYLFHERAGAPVRSLYVLVIMMMMGGDQSDLKKIKKSLKKNLTYKKNYAIPKTYKK
jgi:hypothetical protein